MTIIDLERATTMADSPAARPTAHQFPVLAYMFAYGVSGPAKSSVTALSGPKKTIPESSDDYPDIVVMLDSKTRIIAADIQWIIQKRRREGRHPWEGVYYCRSKEGLLLYAPKPTKPALLALPDWFTDRGPDLLAWNI